MLDLFNIAQPQGCNIQTFYGDGSATGSKTRATWVKPRGVSHVYILMIGAGAPGTPANFGGGSGAVTVFYTAAQNIPDTLWVWVGAPGTTYVSINSAGTSGTFLTANAGSGQAGGGASGAPSFAAQGIFKSTAGQDGSAGAVAASGTTFLSGGGPSGGVTANYGYSVANNAGFFLMQPIIVGVGGSGANPGGIGCGGGILGGGFGAGGPGMVLIASW